MSTVNVGITDIVTKWAVCIKSLEGKCLEDYLKLKTVEGTCNRDHVLLSCATKDTSQGEIQTGFVLVITFVGSSVSTFFFISGKVYWCWRSLE